MKRVTFEDVMKWKPCFDYPRERIEELFAGRETLGWREILALGLPAKDLLWVFLRPEFLSERRLHLLACDFAERALLLIPEGLRGIAEESIRVKRLWVDGEATDEELAAHREAAWAAAAEAEQAARVAVWAAADAAWAAARAAAWEAQAAARERAATALAAATVQEATAQLALIRAALEEEEGEG